MEKPCFAIMAAAALAALSAAAAPAFAKDIVLPNEKVMLRPSTLPGYQKAQQECVQCHSAHYLEYQPPTTTRGYWEAQIKRMKTVFNAPVPDEDIPLIADYLVQTYSVRHDSPQPPGAALGR
jgi:hypothetical protein